MPEAHRREIGVFAFERSGWLLHAGGFHGFAGELGAVEVVVDARRLEKQAQVEAGCSRFVKVALPFEHLDDRCEHVGEIALECGEAFERHIRLDNRDDDFLVPEKTCVLRRGFRPNAGELRIGQRS